MTIQTITTEAGEIIRTMTPVEYQKAHEAEERRTRKAEEMTGLIHWMQDSLGLLREMPKTNIPSLVEEYLVHQTAHAKH